MADTDPAPPVRIGVIADTHGRVPAGVADAFQGVSLIIHAGDVGPESVIWGLTAIARVEAVAGNTDTEPSSPVLPAELAFVHGGVCFYVTHSFDPMRSAAPAETDIIVAGHTHVPEVFDVNGSLFVNPGSATRSRTPDGQGTVAVLELGEGEARVTVARLSDAANPHR